MCRLTGEELRVYSGVIEGSVERAKSPGEFRQETKHRGGNEESGQISLPMSVLQSTRSFNDLPVIYAISIFQSLSGCLKTTVK